MTETTPEPKKKPDQLLLRVVVVCLLILYVVLAGYLMYTNQNIGATQLGYSSLLAKHLGQLQEATGQVVTSLDQLQDDQKTRVILLNARIADLETQLKLVAQAMKSREEADTKSATGLAADLGRTQQELTALRESLKLLKTEDQRGLAVIQEHFKTLQTGLAVATQRLDGQQAVFRNDLQSELAKVRQELGQTAETIKGQTQRELLARMATDALERTKVISATADQNLAVSHQVWERGRLLADLVRLEPSLVEQGKELQAASVALGSRLAVAVAGEVAKYERQALAAEALKDARTNWSKAGEILGYFPIVNDPTTPEKHQNLVLAHESVRQKIQAKFPGG